MVNKLVEHCAQMGYVAANLGGVVTQIPIVEKVARVSVNLAPNLHLHLQLQHLALVVISPDSLALLFSIRCLNTETMDAALGAASTLITLSFLQLALSVALAQPVMTTLARRRLLLSWPKLLTKPQVPSLHALNFLL